MTRSHEQPQTDYQPAAEGVLSSFLIGAGAFAGLSMIALIYASSLPLEASQEACSLQRVGTGEIKKDSVVHILTPQESLMVLQLTQTRVQGSQHPDYIPLPRVRMSNRNVVVLPEGMSVKTGDVLTYTQGHRAADLPCHYIPNFASASPNTGEQAAHSGSE